jgi:general secretion pathway protein G
MKKYLPTIFSSKYLTSKGRDSRSSGFTLIELLIVIAIIGILATLISANYIGVRQRARDTARKSDMRQLQSALELYKSDVGSYPNGFSNKSVTNTASCNNASRVAFSYNSINYMTKVPCDPLSSSTFNAGNYYYTSATGATYTLAACLENSNDGDTDSTTTSPGAFSGTCSSGKYYVLINP